MLTFKKRIYKTDKLYNSVLKLSRNKLLYINLNLTDTFYTRIYLIFFHISFLLIKIKGTSKFSEAISQKIFDYTFNQIDQNMREIGYGDMTVNKKMKSLIRSFYNILVKCENYQNMNLKDKNDFLSLYFLDKTSKNQAKVSLVSDYFDKFRLFSTNLSLNLIERGHINFSYFK